MPKKHAKKSKKTSHSDELLAEAAQLRQEMPSHGGDPQVRAAYVIAIANLELAAALHKRR